MKKILPILIVSILVLSGFGAGAISEMKMNTILHPTPANEYDMVIIAPEKFSTLIQPLIEHKNSYGIQTVLKTTENIYNEYEGRDKPEQIKYFIKDAIEQWGITYVLLVGGLKYYIWNNPRDTINFGEEYWHVPVRYSNLVEPRNYNWHDPGFISDLYYADIYDDTGDFSSWDTDNNGIFGEWNLRNLNSHEKDLLDLYPDVYVGRLACRNKNEVKVVVDKIITYESQTYGEDWYNKIILAGGNSFHDSNNYFEGELHCNYIFDNYMSEYTPIKLYASNADIDPQHTPIPENVIRELSSGSGFFFADAHGKPGKIRTYWTDELEEHHIVMDIISLLRLKNGYKLPIALIGGCSSARINISIFYPDLKNIIEDSDGFWDIIGVSCPKSLCWGLVSKKGGGSIATIGYTGLAYVSFQNIGEDLDGDGINDPDYVEEKHGYLFSSFFKQIDDGVEILGEAWASTITRFLDTWPVMERWEDAKNIQAWILLGDPSLKIGGYPPQQNQVAIYCDESGSSEPNKVIGFEAHASQQPNSYVWDLDNDGEFDDATGKEITEQWGEPGVHWVSVKAIYDDTEIIAHTIVDIEKDKKPNKPEITGPNSGSVGQTKTYTISTDDPYNDDLFYMIDWGDETYDVKGPAASGESVVASHKWSQPGSYSIKVKAYDSFAGESETRTLSVSMPKAKNSFNDMPLLARFLENHPLLARLLSLPIF